MKEQSLSSKEMLLNIGSMTGNATKLLKLNKSYSKLLEQILKYDFVQHDDAPAPSIKELVKASGLKYEAVRTQLQAIYHDLIVGDDELPVFSFPKLRYSFLLRGLGKDKLLHIAVDQLPAIPRIGEEIRLPFFSAYLGTSYFHVEKIEHEFTDGEQEVIIWIREGFYNTYWHYRKDKAKEENELSLFEFFHLSEYELKAKLGVGKY